TSQGRRWVGGMKAGRTGSAGALSTISCSHNRTGRLVCQACEWFGLTRAVALGLDGINWPLGPSTGWGRPEVGQHDTQPHQDQDHQLIVDEVGDHGIASLHGERRPFYPVFERSELSAGLRYATFFWPSTLGTLIAKNSTL